MLNVPNHKKGYKSYFKGQEALNSSGKNLQFPGVGKILRR